MDKRPGSLWLEVWKGWLLLLHIHSLRQNGNYRGSHPFLKTWRKVEVERVGKRDVYKVIFQTRNQLTRLYWAIVSFPCGHWSPVRSISSRSIFCFSRLQLGGKRKFIWNYMLFTPGSFVTVWKLCLPIKVLEAVFLWHREACPQDHGHLGKLDPGREGFPACCLFSVPRMCAGLWQLLLKMALVRAHTLQSRVLIPWFNLCLMPLWSQLKSLYLFDLWFFFLSFSL